MHPHGDDKDEGGCDEAGMKKGERQEGAGGGCAMCGCQVTNLPASLCSAQVTRETNRYHVDGGGDYGGVVHEGE